MASGLAIYYKAALRRKPILQIFEEAFALFVVVVFQAVLKGFQGFALGAVQLLGKVRVFVWADVVGRQVREHPHRKLDLRRAVKFQPR